MYAVAHLYTREKGTKMSETPAPPNDDERVKEMSGFRKSLMRPELPARVGHGAAVRAA